MKTKILTVNHNDEYEDLVFEAWEAINEEN